jgi:hypothetical protein
MLSFRLLFPNKIANVQTISFSLYKDQWVFTSFERAEAGFLLHAAPARALPVNDRTGLAAALRDLLNADIPVVPTPARDDPRYRTTPECVAVGARNWSAFSRRARSFHVTPTKQGFSAEEWSKEKSAFVANPVRWREEYEGFDAMLDGLIQHATDASLRN